MTKEILSIFKPGEVLSYYEYIERVLYTPGIGYYANASRKRVGYTEGTDFYTSMNVGNGIFGKLVLRSIERLLPSAVQRGQTNLIEVGAEPGYSIIDLEEAKLFQSQRVLRLGESLVINGEGLNVIFANELLDAQPFQRFRYANGNWEELGVEVSEDGKLREVVLGKDRNLDKDRKGVRQRSGDANEDVSKGVRQVSEDAGEGAPKGVRQVSMELAEGDRLLKKEQLEAKIRSKLFNAKVEEGYIIDYPTGAELMLQGLVEGGWKGMIVLFDYGFSWERLCHDCPQGTGRGYKEHQIINDLLMYPGQMDITCHICWDFCREILVHAGFNPTQLESQEKFLVQYSSDLIQEMLEESAGMFSKQKQGLMELLHPGHMGQKFQVLWGLRL